MKHKDCVRCEKRRPGMTGYHCCRQDYMIDIDPDGEACDRFLSRKEREEQERKWEEEREKRRKAAWTENENNPPVKLPIVFDGYGYIPECPTCGEMPYSTTQCHWCGQKFIQDEEVLEYSKPITKEISCFKCGKTMTVNVSKYNGHKSGHCKNCGMSFIE